jgi:Ca2+-binding RTX toxin-like protein
LSTVNFVDWNNWSGDFDIVTIHGTAAADTIDGSMKNDTIFAYDGANTVRGGQGSDVVHGGALADILRGGDGYDSLYGGGGNDILIGDDDLAGFPAAKSGDDSIYGGDGNDTIMALRGQNVVDGGAGSDTVDYGFLVQDPAGTQVPVHVLIDLSRTVDPNNPDLGYSAYIDLDYTEVFIPAVRDILVGVENVAGTVFNDRITGNGEANRLSGRDGTDTLTGLGGNDQLDGGAGNDRMDGGDGHDIYVTSGGDTIVEQANGGTDTVRSSVHTSLGANVERLELIGSSALNGVGNTLSNVLTGNGAVNVLDGRLGFDILTGGAGNDHFLFTTALGVSNVDRITDFSVPEDTIRVDDAVFLGLSLGRLATGGLAKNATGFAQDSSDRIIYETDTGALFFDRDGTGTTYGRVQFATLATGLGLTESDFVVI